MPDLSERQAKLLQVIIDEYVATAEPVGSETIVKKFDLGVSPATIRNDMVRLAEEGYLEKSYSSSGRVPTPLGFRFYIKTLMAEKKLPFTKEQILEIMKKHPTPFHIYDEAGIRGNAKKFREATGKEAIVGGLKNFLETKPNKPSEVIVASNVEQLFETTTLLLEYGVKSILLEKPGATNSEQMRKLSELAKEKSADVVLAYNRRFYSSTDKAIEIIKEDGGVTSFNFEFTEWSHTIEVLNKPKETFEAWLVANSSHVINMAFFLGGYPEKMSSYSAGEKVLKWHPRASIFAGSGVSHTNALFSYQANWSSPGRWSVEMITRKHRLIFRPMEKLQIQDIGSVAINSVEINDTIDK